jgi:transcriptional regulator with XRE-family HTH domain
METATPSRLRAARKRMGLSQEELARRTGVPRTTLRDAELRLHVPRGDYVARLYRYTWGWTSTTFYTTSRPKTETRKGGEAGERRSDVTETPETRNPTPLAKAVGIAQTRLR